MKIVWFRQDLRLQDNPALAEAAASGEPFVPVYVWDPRGEGNWPPGAASRWWLHRSLAALDQSLRAAGSRLILRTGPAEEALRELVRATGADGVYWNRRYEPAAVGRDRGLKSALGAAGLTMRSFNASLLFEPTEVANREGRPFQVFSPFWRHCLSREVAAPQRLRGPLVPPERWPRSLDLPELGLIAGERWSEKLVGHWQPGEAGGGLQLKAFTAGPIADYASTRDRPAAPGTSRLSPWLHFGEIGPRQVWAAVRARSRESGVFPAGKGEATFLNEIGWREFGYHLLFHYPETPEQPLRARFAHFPWAPDPEGSNLAAWRRGRTGYPMVDAGLRELWETGWMHNRVRMIVASFLVKHLRLSWQQGAAWFWDTLVDADLANNTLGWQWSAGCGADAAPYFRIFAPVLQGRKFDADGAYVRRWVPELARLPNEYLHAPWDAPVAALEGAGVELGRTYPRPVVDHPTAHAAALAAFRTLPA